MIILSHSYISSLLCAAVYMKTQMCACMCIHSGDNGFGLVIFKHKATSLIGAATFSLTFCTLCFWKSPHLSYEQAFFQLLSFKTIQHLLSYFITLLVNSTETDVGFFEEGAEM